MVRKCIINNCSTTKQGDGITLHSLPEDPKQQQEWFRSILNKTGQSIFRENDVICSKHFSKDSFSSDGILKSSAVPFHNMEEISENQRIKTEKAEEPACSVFTCGNMFSATQHLRPNLVYYNFPDDGKLAQKWKEFCNKLDNDFENSYICSDHFVPDDFVTGIFPNKQSKLKTNALPSIYKHEIQDENYEIEDQISPTNMTDVNEAKGHYSVEQNEFYRTGRKFCSVDSCNSHNDENLDVEYYPLPTLPNLRRTWIKIIQNYTKQRDVADNAFICSLHFPIDSFRKNLQTRKKVLLASAVPSIFPTPKIENEDFPTLNAEDFLNPECGRNFYEWSQKNHQKQKKYIDYLKHRHLIQGKRIGRLAKSIDDFKAKKYISDEANNALQNLFDQIIATQYEFT